MKPYTRALLILHLCVFIWGFTAILGKWISYGAIPLVYHRMLIAAIVYMFFPRFWKGIRSMSAKTIIQLAGIGLIVCAHWLCFYGSIKIGNSVSVTLAALGTASLFSAFIDPWINKRKILKQEIILGLFIIVGVLLVCYAIQKGNNNIKTDTIPMLAVWVGIASAALAALFTALHKKYVSQHSAVSISGIEMISGTLGMVIFLVISNGWQAIMLGEWTNTQDMVALFILAIVCTNLTFWLGTLALKELSAFTANLTVNLEPIYGMLLGAAIFHEYQSLNMYFYLGAGIILVSVIGKPALNLWRAQQYKRHNKKQA